jgi:FkbM family methyltransferase
MSFFVTFLALLRGQIKAHTGQYGEDVIIKKLFESKKKDGFYVDLGANHPFEHSNTAWFWLNGWSGINVDANQKSIAIFNEIRRNDVNLNFAIIPSEKYKRGVRKIDFYFPDLVREVKGNAKTATVHKKTADKRGFKKKQNVDAIDINTLFNIHKITEIDFLNIDIEGLDEEVLLDLDFNKVKINVIAVEDYLFDLSPHNQSKITTFMVENNFIFKARVGPTSIFERSKSFDSH